MKNLIEVPQQLVYSCWEKYDRLDSDGQLRPDIIGRHHHYPTNVIWYNAEIEASDIAKLYIISTPDFDIISKNTWLIQQAAINYRNGIIDPEHLRRIESLLVKPGGFDPRIIAVSHDKDGPFTIIEGNHRAIILQDKNQLVGQTCFLGLHYNMQNFTRACKAYYFWNQQRSVR